jgi:hypothetical protein
MKEAKASSQNQAKFSSSNPGAMAPPDKLSDQLKGKSALSAFQICIIKPTSYQRNNDAICELCKQKLSKPKPAKITTFLLNLNDSKFHLSSSKLQTMESAYFNRFLLHKGVLMTPAI